MDQTFCNLAGILALLIAVRPFIVSTIMWVFPWVVGSENKVDTERNHILYVKQQPRRRRYAPSQMPLTTKGDISSTTTITQAIFRSNGMGTQPGSPIEQPFEVPIKPLNNGRRGSLPYIMDAVRHRGKNLMKTPSTAVSYAVDNVPHRVKRAMRTKKDLFPNSMTPAARTNNNQRPSFTHSESSPVVLTNPQAHLFTGHDGTHGIFENINPFKTAQTPTRPPTRRFATELDETIVRPLDTPGSCRPTRLASYEVPDLMELPAVLEHDEVTSRCDSAAAEHPVKVMPTVRPRMARSRTSGNRKIGKTAKWHASERISKNTRATGKYLF